MKRLVLLAVIGLLLGLVPAHANYWEGYEAFRRGDYYTAHKEFLRLAQLGQAAAQFNLGYLYHHGLAVSRDPAEAAKWYRASAEQGRVEAQFSLGTLYETGSGVPRDLALAYRWYNLAASNVPPGVSRDRLRQHRDRVYRRLSAEQLRAVETSPGPDGFTLAANLAVAEVERPAPAVADIQRKLAERSFNPGAIDGRMSLSTVGALSAFQASSGLEVTGEADRPTLDKLFGPEEVAPHLEPFPRAAAVRKEPAPPAVPVPPVEMVKLGPSDASPAAVAEASDDGTAPPQPPQPPQPTASAPAVSAPVAATAASEAAPQEPESTEGSGGADDPAGLRRLAEQGDAAAQINLATMYHYGQGVAQDTAEAVRWYTAAARQGRVDALFPLGSLYESRASGPQDLAEAYRWYSLAADLTPAGKAHDIIAERRDRVAKQLSPARLASAKDETGASDQGAVVALRNRPVPPPAPNRPPSGLAFATPDGTALSAAMVAENAAGGTLVGTLNAENPDAGDVLSFELSDAAGGRFVVDAESGALRVAEGARLDYEEAASHDIVVRVTDSGGLSYETALTVRLRDVDEAPQIAAGSFVVAENAAAGSLLGRIAASDPDGGANGKLGYALAGDGPFAIDPATGAVTVAEGAALDFETRPRFEMMVTATDGGGLSAHAPLTVTLEDSNEAPGGIEMAVGGTVAEQAPAGTVVGRVGAADPDAGDRLSYGLVEDAGGRFTIDAETGTIRVAEGADLDFETGVEHFTVAPDGSLAGEDGRPEAPNAVGHRVVVRVTDAGGLSRDAALAIQVADVNETPWAEAGAFSVDENAPGGTVVGRLEAGDPDGGANGTLSYAITGGEDSARFAIDAKTGLITVARGAALDFEARPAYGLSVTVTDGGGLSDTAAVGISLRDRNEPPVALDMTGGSVAEHAAGGTLVARLTARDPDAGDYVTYSLTDDAGGRFVIDAKSGTLSVAEGADLDFDAAPSHEIGVRVTDPGGLSYSERLTIAVANENFAPTGIALGNGRVEENAPAGTPVAEVRASDPDAGERLTYSLTEDAGGRFTIDPGSGRITVSDRAQLDYEVESGYQIKVRVTDSGGLSHDEALAITVLDVNEAPKLAAGSFALDEIADAGTTVGRLRASDPDHGVNGRLRYVITGGNRSRSFDIDPESGVITVAEGAHLDFEEQRYFELEVTAIDGGGLSDSARITIALVDRNEPPEGLYLIGGQVPENAGRGRFAGQVVAMDPDAGDSLSYGLTDDAGGRFAIDAKSGTITVADGSRLDFESAARYRLAVRVTDSGGLTYDGDLSIALSDANEAPKAKSSPLRVTENAAAGTVVGRLDASDPDAGDRLSYRLSDDAGGRFAIDARSGTITVAPGARLDFESDPRFEVSARVTDSGGLGDTVVFAIDLADANEAPSGSVTIDGMVAENALPGTLAAAFTASDPDRGDRLTYSLTDDAGGRFAIDPRRGLITVAAGADLDFERAPVHEVRVRATDKGGLSVEQPLTIALIDVDETPATKEELLAEQGAASNGFARHDETLGAGGATDGTLDGSLDGKLGGTLDGTLAGKDRDASQAANWVAAIQRQLLEAGFDPGPIDGKMGPLTRTALSRYQEAFRLTDLKEPDLLNHMLVRAHFRRGYKHQVDGEYEKSIAEYAEVLRIEPDHFSAHFNRGLSYYAENRYDQAIEDFDKVIALRPGYAGAFVNRGNAYYRQGLYAAAARDYVTAIGLWISSWL